MPRRATGTRPKKYGEPVYSWAFLSSQPRGGQFITYETRLEEDGEVRCNCPGWVFAKKDKPRGCKHTHAVAEEAPRLWRDWLEGRPLPRVTPSLGQVERLLQARGVAFVPEDNSRIRYGRVIDMD